MSNADELKNRIIDLRISLQADPDDVSARYELAYAFFSLGELELSLSEFAHLCKVDPDDHESLHGLGCVLRGLGRLEDAGSTLRKAIELWPKEPEYYASLGDTLAQLGSRDEALKMYEEGLDRTIPGEEAIERLVHGINALSK